MKRAGWVLLPLAALLVWASAFLDLGAKRPAPALAPTTEPVIEEEAREAPPEIESPDAPAQPDPPKQPTPAPIAVAPATTTTAKPAAQPPVEPVGTGELGDGIKSPEYNALEHLYVREIRDAEWARQQEERVQALFRGQPISKNLKLVYCQETLCRMLLEDLPDDGFERLLRVPNLRQETGLSSSTPYSLRSGQLSVYFKRADGAQP